MEREASCRRREGGVIKLHAFRSKIAVLDYRLGGTGGSDRDDGHGGEIQTPASGLAHTAVTGSPAAAGV
jgi:hypothetical protein